MAAIAQRPGRIDWNALLARTAKKDPGFEPALRKGETVTGLVVSIGVLNLDGSAVPDHVVTFLRTLGGTPDLAYRANEDEFALIWRGEQGAAAQQRLAKISQDLWDFQLTAMGDVPLLFSWGGAQVENEPMDEAIAIASMRMQETRRGRKAMMNGRLKVASVNPAAPARLS